MSSGYVVAGYGITMAALGLYALRVVRRGRALARSFRTNGSAGGPPVRDEAPGERG